PEQPAVASVPLERVLPGDAVHVASVGKRGRVEEFEEGGRRVAVRGGALRLGGSPDELAPQGFTSA
ncbi:MAG: hypothetical protein KKF66_05025, partial [Actinobacteria bacterium]|nr:hypothetical protein [Actinomycetota bacterium]